MKELEAREPDHQVQDWWSGESLGKRSARLGPEPDVPCEAFGGGDLALRWREQFPFADPAVFRRRLDAAGLTPAAFDRLTSPRARPSDGAPPDWVAVLHEAYRSRTRNGLPVAAHTADRAEARLSAGVWPVVRWAAERLRAEAEALHRTAPSAPFTPDAVVEGFTPVLLDGLHRLAMPTMVLEVNLARLRGQLSGETAADRFASFVEQLAEPARMLDLLGRYPVLAGQLVVRAQQWVDGTTTFLRHLTADRESLRHTFARDAGGDIGRLTRVRGHAGDRHRGGRSVLVLEFDSGLRLVYKPRSLAVDRHVQEALAWVDRRVSGPDLRTLAVLERGTHGWVEFVEAADCASPDAVRRFYERQGALLAVVHVLCGSDLHCENVIAAGEHPVLVDVEAMFHPRLPGRSREVDGVAGAGMADSVLRTGMLPIPLRMTPDGPLLDRSGLGANSSRTAPLASLQCEGAGTDEPHLMRRRRPVRPSAHLPRLAGGAHPRVDVPAVLHGFRRTYRALLRHRKELLAPGGPLARFRGDEVRVVLRHTATYSRLLTESYHPDVLRDGLERDLLFDRLWGDVVDCPYLARVVTAEIRDLWNGDIPAFTAHVGSRDLTDSTGTTIADVLPESGDAMARGRIERLDEADLARQEWLIRASLTTMAPDRVLAASDPGLAAGTAAAETSPALALAQRAGDRIAGLAVRAEDGAGWIGLVRAGEAEWAVRPLGPDLYDGTAGIALFLAHLGAITGEARYTDLAMAAVANLRLQVAGWARPGMPIGAFTGAGGVVYMLTRLAELWCRDDLLDDAEDLVSDLGPAVGRDVHHDVMAGAAGCLAGLLALHRVRPSARVLAAAARCGDRLVETAVPVGGGLGWPSPAFGVALGGFSHGASGIAWALRHLAAACGDARYHRTAALAERFEDGLFDPRTGNWADLRSGPGLHAGESTMVAWCHGAAGIGAAHVTARPSSGPASISAPRPEILRAVASTLASPFGHDVSLCHGDLGKLDFLLAADRAHPEAGWRPALHRLRDGVLERLYRPGWRCGNGHGQPTPGLMTGLAGIGYGLLRLADPDRVPSVLTFELTTEGG